MRLRTGIIYLQYVKIILFFAVIDKKQNLREFWTITTAEKPRKDDFSKSNFLSQLKLEERL